MTDNKSQPSCEWLLQMAEMESKCESISVGGMAFDLGLLSSNECQVCGIGFYLPSGRCDHCDVPRSQYVHNNNGLTNGRNETMEHQSKFRYKLKKVLNLINMTLTLPIFGLGIALMLTAFYIDVAANWIVCAALWLRGCREDAINSWKQFVEENF